jgi:hypothetical protein
MGRRVWISVEPFSANRRTLFEKWSSNPAFYLVWIPVQTEVCFKGKIPGIKDLGMRSKSGVLFCNLSDQNSKAMDYFAKSIAPFYKTQSPLLQSPRRELQRPGTELQKH